MNPQIYFDEVNERQGVFNRRAFILGGTTAAAVVALGGRLGYLQLVDADRYKLLSEHNQFDFRLQPPPRGLIVDRNGVILASNRGDFRLFVKRDEHTDIELLLDRLAKLVPIDDAHRARLMDDIKDAPRGAPVTVMEDLTWEEFSRINVRAPELPGVTADMGEIRVYPYTGAFAHVIGYVARVSRDDVTKEGPNADPILLNPGFRIGKEGLEKTFDLDLRGKAGAKKVEVDVKGRVVREDASGDIPSTPGQTLQLTLDSDIQNRAMEVFGEESGAAVMMDCRNGDVLCLFSGPSFDANRFVKGLTRPEYSALSGYERKPLFNKALSATFPAGSTFKTMVALTALEAGVSPDKTHTCSGAFPFGGHVFHCDKAHGTLNMHQAIVTSCDIFFYNTALEVGPDAIAVTARKFGINQTFDEIHIKQSKGTLPDTAWKQRVFHERWWPGETPSFGIGQGALAVNPLQLCVMCSRIANGHKALMPRLVKSVGGEELPPGSAVPDIAVAPEHLAFVRSAMADVVTSGTAASTGQLGLGPVMMAGKTGTAQAHTYAGGRATLHLGWAQRDHAWFIAFAPADQPRYAMSVLVEHGGWGASAAAPKAREIMRVALLKDPEIRARIETPLPSAAPTPPGAATAPGPAPATPSDSPAAAPAGTT